MRARGSQQQQQPKQAYRPRTDSGKSPRKGNAKNGCKPCLCTFIWVALLLGCLGGVVAAYRYRYPSKQRCPPEGDRFYEHCKEGRTHYQLEMDWDCLGPRRAEALREALSQGKQLEDEGKPLVGIGYIPSWLTDEDAAALRGAACMNNVKADKACWYCKPSPKPTEASNAELRDKLKAAEAISGGGVTETGPVVQGSAASEEAEARAEARYKKREAERAAAAATR